MKINLKFNKNMKIQKVKSLQEKTGFKPRPVLKTNPFPSYVHPL